MPYEDRAEAVHSKDALGLRRGIGHSGWSAKSSAAFLCSPLPIFRRYSCGTEARAGDKYRRANGSYEIDSHEPREDGHSHDISDRAGWLDPPELRELLLQPALYRFAICQGEAERVETHSVDTAVDGCNFSTLRNAIGADRVRSVLKVIYATRPRQSIDKALAGGASGVVVISNLPFKLLIIRVRKNRSCFGSGSKYPEFAGYQYLFIRTCSLANQLEGLIKHRSYILLDHSYISRKE